MANEPNTPARAGSVSRRSSQSSPAGPSAAADVPGFRLRPLQVTWEMTRACEWNASPARVLRRQTQDEQRHEFSTAEAFHLIEQVTEMRVPLLALTGGDPLLRPDLFPIVEFAARRSVRTSLALLPTPLLNAEAIAELKACGLMRAAFWMHGSTAALHDAYTGVAGSHRRTAEAVGLCHEADLPVQINTIVSRRNFHDVDPMIDFLTRLDVVLWNVFFFVPPNPSHSDELMSAQQHEDVFGKLYAASQRVHFQVKTIEGQHYQRYLLEQRVRESRGRLSMADILNHAPKAVSEGIGSVFINHRGGAYPSRFLPLSAGNITEQSLMEVYHDSPIFISLRDSTKLKGKCGRCPVRNVCGGSRARAYAMTGDLFAEDPCCAYQP